MLLPVQAASQSFVVRRCIAGSSCNPDTNEVGYRTVGASGASTVAIGGAQILKWAADCSGQGGEAWVALNTNSSQKLKVCLYNLGTQSETTPGSGATQIACSTLTTFPAGGGGSFVTLGSLLTSASVTNGTYYWVATFNDSTSPATAPVKYTTGGTSAVSGTCASSTSDLSTCSWTGQSRTPSMYVEIQ